ncbi:hypothetical protein BP6252_02911 [Coleophoma cylindrospora]|uniref:Major facilitator superfamily (MFS) profile domain-containing protein n=1 Tax=Coleophoma cylindrospora TaxID=1849047 RepID=A0A3D8SGL2_9HELO|nr:hypothetical protein BP6252_02911 [Coleophoma cylindrospora]
MGFPETVGNAPEMQAPLDKAESLDMDLHIDPVKERKMMLKFDVCAIGMLGLFYMMANLDRGNLGNANIAGMSEEIGLVGNQFGTAVTLLYATYVTIEVPTAILLKIIGPRYLLAGCAFCWGVTTLGMGFIQNVAGLYTCRLLIGFFEAAIFPCIDVYIGMVYKKEERGTRSAVIFAFSSFSSAFGGLLAFGLTQIHGPNGFSGWRWLFIVEGVITLFIVPLYWFLFPNDARTAWFLTAEEKRMVHARYELDPHWGIDDEFSWGAITSVLIDPKFYAFFIFQFCCDVSLYAIQTFLPAIVKGLGYTSVTANLMTVPVYMLGLVWFLFVAYMSDRTKLRGIWIAGPLLLLILGLAILIGVDKTSIRFFGCFVTILGIYPTVGLSIMWMSDNVGRHFKRASMVGMVLTIANTAGVAVGQIYRTEDSPRYIKGLEISLGLNVVAFVMVMALMGGMWWVNRKRAAAIQKGLAEGNPVPAQPEKGDYDPHFVYTL